MCWNAGIHIARIVRETSITSLKWSLTKWLRPAETNNIYLFWFVFELNSWNFWNFEFLKKIMKIYEFPSLSIAKHLRFIQNHLFRKSPRNSCFNNNCLLLDSNNFLFFCEKSTMTHGKKYSWRGKLNKNIECCDSWNIF